MKKMTTVSTENYPKLQTLLQRSLEVEADLSEVTSREMTGDDEMFLNNIIKGLKDSSMGELLIREYHNAGEGSFQLLVLCARMYLAGKCSAQRYDDAAPQHAASSMLPTPSPLRTSVAA
jgi:hypothetical protein